MREFLKSLELDSKVIDSIMAEYGKTMSKDKEELQTLRDEVTKLKENSKSATELQEKYDKLAKEIEEKEAQAKAEEEDKILTKNILEVFGDKKFVNDYTKNSIMNELKNGLKDKNNVGKSASDLFNSITKDRTDIFVNDNAIKDMPGMGDTGDTNINKPVKKEIKLNPMFKNFN